MKKVLFIAYNFPPCGGPGVQRSSKYIKYLSETNWTPIVITTFEDSYPIIDKSLLNDIPQNTIIYRARTFDINKFRSYFSKLGLGKLHGLINTLLAFPDSAIFWSFYSRSLVRKIIKEHNPELIYTTSGPYSSHLLGLWVKKNFNIQWVADFRDLWSLNRFVKYLFGYRKLNQILESKVLKAADKIVVVSEIDGYNFERLAPIGKSISVIHNGFDIENFPKFGIASQIYSNKFRITYTGNFSSTRKPDQIILAAKKLIEKGIIDTNSIEIIFAGADLDRFLPIEFFIKNLGYQSHDKLEELRQNTNMMLLIQDTSNETLGDYSGKIFEYLASGKPILAVTNLESVAAKLIKDTRAGYCVGNDINDIMDLMEICYKSWENRSFNFNPDWSQIKKYSRANATKKLIDIFDDLLGTKILNDKIQ